MTIYKLYESPTMVSGRPSTGSHSSSEFSESAPPENALDAYLKKRDVYLSAKKNSDKAQVEAAFVTKKHMVAMQKASEEGKFAGSFRSAGGPTLAALNMGMAAKGHNILEKTIKPGSLKAVYGDEADKMFEIVTENRLAGIVGAWGGEGKSISGVYVHDKSRPGTSEEKDMKFPLSLTDPLSIEAFHKEVSEGNIIPYTGDYDMHDIIKFDGERGYVPEADGKDEKAIIKRINEEVFAVDRDRPSSFEAMNVVRHGPQVNFVPHMWGHEKDNVIQNDGYLGVVANMGEFPVAFVNGKEWEILKHWPALYIYYMDRNTPIPEHWRQGSLIERNEHFVATHDHARELDALKGKP